MPRVDRVASQAAQHDVVAIACRDGVAATHPAGDRPHAVNVVRAYGVVGRSSLSNLFSQIVHQPLIAKDDVVAVRCRGSTVAGERIDDVVAAAAKNHIATDAGRDRIVAVTCFVTRTIHRARVDGRHQSQDLHLVVVVRLGRIRIANRTVQAAVDTQDLAVVTEDNVLAAASINTVMALTSHDDVVCPIARDHVTFAPCGERVDALDTVKSIEIRIGCTKIVETEVAHVAVVAEDDVGVGIAGDVVGAVTSEEAISPGIAVNRVVVTVGWLIGANVGHSAYDQDLLIVWDLLHHDTVVAELNIVSGVAFDRVFSRDKLVAVGCWIVVGRTNRVGRGHRQHATDDIDIDTRVPVNQVVARVAGDHVIARAARQDVADLRAANRVVAIAAVDHDAQCIASECACRRRVG